MKKNKAGKVVQMLSPSNYIKTKARNLPIYECRVQPGWENDKLAQVLVARTHTNGNITAAVYLVDLLCVGIKDTTYLFNHTKTDYEDFLNEFTEQGLTLEQIDYNLAHNIVYASIEFAETYDFKPHREFESITKYILDEDTEEIPLIEIECGSDGLPTVLVDLWEDSKALNRVVSQLEKTAGPGNYLLIYEDGRVFDGLTTEYLDDDDGYDDYNEFDALSIDEKGEIFKELHPKLIELDEEEQHQYYRLVESIIDEFIDTDEYEKFHAEFSRILSVLSINSEEVPDELLNAKPGTVSKEVKNEFLQLIENINPSKKWNDGLKSFKKHNSVEAAHDFLIFRLYLKKGQEKKARELIQELLEKYPDYILARLANEKLQLLENPEFNVTEITEPEVFFGSRTEIHPLELYYYVDLLTGRVISLGDFSALCAWKDILISLPIAVENISMLTTIITFMQINIACDYFKVKGL